jgi:hypothetical protein
MKTLYNKIFLSIVGALFLFAACEESILDRESSPIMPDNCQGVYFPSTNPAVIEMEPTEPTQITIDIARVDSVSAVEVPITVDVNTDNVFVVPAKAVFAAGEKITTITVTFPTAGEGIAYSLRLSVSGDEYVNKYASTVSYVLTSVTRIKWSTTTGTTGTTEPFVYIDGTFLTFYGVSQIPMYVETEKAEVGDVVRYRFKNPFRVATPGNWYGDDYIPEPDADGIYNGYYYNYPGDVDETRDYYIVIEIDKKGNVSMIPSELGVIWSYGMFSIGSIYGYVSTNIDLYPLGSFEEGEEGNVITFPTNSLYISMANYNNGGKYPCATPTIIYTTKAAYIAANLKIKDFNEVEYEEIEGAVSEFESAAYSESWNQTIAKAIDIDPNNEDSEYKDLYYLAGLYAEDFGLAFYYNGKTVSIPAAQKIGEQMYNKDIYVSQSETIESSVVTNSKGITIYTLGLKFHFVDGTVIAEFAEIYYYSKDPVSYELTDFCGDFTMKGISLFGQADAQRNVSIVAGTESNTFVITGIQYAESVRAIFDPQTSVLIIRPQSLPDYGQYDVTLYTYDNTVSQSASMSFTRNLKGELRLSPDSEASGYLLGSQAAGGWMDGYYNLVFIPRVATRSSFVPSSLDTSIKVFSDVVSVVKTPKCAKGNFAIKDKKSIKATMKKNIDKILF